MEETSALCKKKKHPTTSMSCSDSSSCSSSTTIRSNSRKQSRSGSSSSKIKNCKKVYTFSDRRKQSHVWQTIQMTVHGMWAARLVQSHMIVMLRPSMRTKMNTACMLFWAPLQMRDVGGLSPEPHQA